MVFFLRSHKGTTCVSSQTTTSFLVRWVSSDRKESFFEINKHENFEFLFDDIHFAFLLGDCVCVAVENRDILAAGLISNGS